ncbi:hypothetical protein J6590_063752 [Homalodisca vitripennis]|nr:hypothetical protein J6590_063752 [Homalodisca vitripennis]
MSQCSHLGGSPGNDPSALIISPQGVLLQHEPSGKAEVRSNGLYIPLLTGINLNSCRITQDITRTTLDNTKRSFRSNPNKIIRF